jgi:predicted nucleic acid-binding protein
VRLFLDTSALAKLFVPEAGTAELNAMLSQPDVEIWVSELARLEFHSLVWRRCREGSLDAAQVTSLLAELDQQLDAWQVIELTPTVLSTARELLATHAAQHALRTLDAIQLASFMVAMEDGAATFACADHRLCAVAAFRGHPTYNPVADS